MKFKNLRTQQTKKKDGISRECIANAAQTTARSHPQHKGFAGGDEGSSSKGLIELNFFRKKTQMIHFLNDKTH